ncbi:MAG: MFS transporter [Rhodospirillaceae bacterium]|nr:MFS transporter [Rhodospirillaceae bacterium]
MSNGAAADTGIQNLKIGPVRFMPGISRMNALTLYYAGFFSIASTVFLSFVQPFIFTEILNIPQEDQGKLAGNLVFFSELVILSLIGVAGVASDKIGRRPVYVFGFAMLAVGYILYPLATSETELIAYRMIFALGVVGATSMLATVQADYPDERDRGKLVGMMGFLQAVGVIVVILTLSKLPQKLTSGGMTPAAAGETALWLFAGICLFNAGVLRFGLKGGVPSAITTRESFLPTLKRGLKAAENPRVALSYVAAMVSRGDLSTVSTFFSLWVMQVGISKGMSSAEALKASGLFFVIVTIAATVWAPVVGILCDRMNRVSALCMAMALATCGYLIAGFLPDPTSAAMYPAAVLLGMAEVNAVLAAQTLIGQEAPKDGRGAVIGVFGVCGGIGILIAGKLGGYLFDEWRPSAPFILMGIANFSLLLLALLVRFKAPGPMPQDAAARNAAAHSA